MAEAEELVNDEGGEEVIEEVSEQEQIARAHGWKSKEESPELVEKNKWVDFDEFNRRQEIFDALKESRKESKRMQKQLNALTAHHENTAKAAYERAKKELMEERMRAAQEGDLPGVIAADDRLRELKPAVPAAASNSNAAEEHPEFAEFVKENDWFVKDPILQNYANGVGARLERENPEMSITDLLEQVKEEVREAFPHKFNQRTTTRATSVTPSRSGPASPSTVDRGTNKSKITYRNLPDEAKKMYKLLVKGPTNPRGVMTAEQYLSEYAAQGGPIED